VIDRIETIVRENSARIKESRIISIETKGSKDNLVTSVDLESERFPKSRLGELIPDSFFIREEG